jgi:hypothetical protein
MKRTTRQWQTKQLDAQNARRGIQGRRFVLMCLCVAFVLSGGDTPSQAQQRADIKSQAKPETAHPRRTSVAQDYSDRGQQVGALKKESVCREK